MAKETPDLEDDDMSLDPPVEPDQDAEAPDDSMVEADEEAPPDHPDEGAAQPPADQEPSRQPSRGERRFQTLTNELANERRQREEMTRRLDALLAGQQNKSAAETPETRAQRRALMTPEEQMREDLQIATGNIQREMQVLHFSTRDQNDKTAFEARAATDPRLSRRKDTVEAELLKLRQQGQNIEREKLFYYLYGKEMYERTPAEQARQSAQAQQRVRRQQVRPGNSGSDVSTSRRERGSTLEKRLENQPL
jgi:hypothetical protein